MKQIRDMIARRRPSGPDGTVEQQTSLISEDEPLMPSPPQPSGSGTTLGLVGDLQAVESEPEPEQDKDLVAARLARDAVPRFSESPRSISDGRPTKMMSESVPEATPDLPKRKIWDMDLDSEDRSSEDVLASALAKSAIPDVKPLSSPAPAPDPVLSAIETMAPERAAPVVPSPSAEAGGRVKTRLLGFHAEDLNQNMFDEPATPAAQPDTRFPIGWVVVVDGPGRGAAFALTAGLSKIGRGEDQTVALDFGDSSISRDNHAAIAFDEEENTAFIGHGGKSNIVRLNGKPLLTTEELQDADLIRIGKTTLRFVALCGSDFRWTNIGDGDAPDADHE